MPRKSASHAAKKDAGGETKSESSTPRRSGRAVTKSESSSGREAASRSRRGSTAAQTAASVADSRGSKGSRNSVGSSRDSTSPSDNRGRSRKEGSETPATRVKGARRNASRINYKESDGEEEAPAPKNDELFDSNDEFEESDSDEKSKPKGRAKVVKPAAKVVGGKKARASGGRSRRGRPVKKKGAKSDEDEESDHETFNVSEDSGDVAEVAPATPVKKAKTPAKPKESASKRGRKTKATPEPVVEEKSKPSRRSSRAAVSKEDTPSIKRPSRSVQAKKYTEEDEDDIEELSDSKAADEEAEEKPEQASSRKRKRNSATEANKRLKEDATAEKEKEVEEADDDRDNVVDDVNMKTDEKDEDKKVEPRKEDAEESDSEEAMEVDESDSVAANKKSEKPEEKKESKLEEIATEEKKVEIPKEQDASISKTNAVPEEKNTDENFDDSASDSEQESKADQSVSSGVEDSQDSQDLPKDKTPTKVDSLVLEKKKIETNAVMFDKLDKKSDDITKESKPVEKQKNDLEVKSTDSFQIENSKPESSNPELNVTHSKEQNADAALNGSEQTPPATNVTHVIHPASSVIFEHKDNSAPKANGDHDSLHNNATDDQNYPFPGRKYIINPKLSENTRSFVKDKTFSILSYNLGESSPEAYVQKDKLLHELDKLQSHVICLQQVAKPLYEVLEPSLDAMGFKGVYSQPEETTKGLATFYKSSLFRAVHFSESSIKKFVDKELEVSTMDSTDKGAVVSHTNVKKYGNVMFTHLNSVIGSHTLTVANVQIPPSEISIQALQVSCLAREVASLIEGANKTYVLCGEFNMKEGEAPYQLLRDGYLSNDMIEELQQRKDVVLPGKENAALINLLWKAFQHPSSNLCSSYASVLDRELSIPEKLTTSPDLLWFSSDSLHTVGVLDVVDSKLPDTTTSHISLKADIAFSV